MSYVAVEGVIGVGKTTMARLVSERVGFPVLFERFEENPFLKRLTQCTPRGCRLCAVLGGVERPG